MKLFHSSFAIVIAGALALGAFAGCDSAGNGVVADGGIRGTGSSVGPVSGFGSVFVNGVEFYTDSILNREVISNDGIEKETDLQKGMILRIDGEWRRDRTGDARLMEYDDTLRGTISNLSANAVDKTLIFTIHNQPVFVDMQTVLQGRLFTSFANGDFVRISAWRQADGRYRASYIGYNPQHYGNDKIEVEGPIDIGSLTDTQFTMNGLIINFGDAEFADGLSVGKLKQGAHFEVEGELIGGALHASRIQKDDFRRYLRRSGGIELAGPVSSGYNSGTASFGLNGLTILITNNTDWDELNLTDLKSGLLVQVEGEFISESVVDAREIEIREGNAKVEGNIDGQCDTSQNCFTVGGVRIQVTSRTIITDDDDDENRLTIADLYSPTFPPASKFVTVEVSGLEKKDEFGKVYIEALQIERELSGDIEDKYEVEGRLDGIKGSDIKILGIWIRTSDGVFNNTSLIELNTRHSSGEEIILEVEYEKAPSGIPYRAVSIEEDS
jgi:hypothetical protein